MDAINYFAGMYTLEPILFSSELEQNLEIRAQLPTRAAVSSGFLKITITLGVLAQKNAQTFASELLCYK